jgi:hypothetical protein
VSAPARNLHALAGRDAFVDGDRMKLVRPVGKLLPAELIDAAREHKDELRTLVSRAEPPPPAIVWNREDCLAFYDQVTGTLLSEAQL